MPVSDAVVIGSGPNGLVAANLLADQGWDVTVLEAQQTAGGAVRSASDVHDGFIHDTFSSFYPLGVASPAIRGLQLERHGLEWVNAPAVAGTPFMSGEWAVMHRTPEETAAALDALAPGDGQAWLDVCAGWQKIGDSVVAALLDPFPPVRSGARVAAKLPGAGGIDFVRMMLSPLQSMAGQRFKGNGAQMLLAGNAAHADIPMDAPGSTIMAWLLAMIGQHLGYPVPKGGAGMFSGAMVRRFTSEGGDLRVGHHARRVLVRDGRATGVETDDGQVFTARRAVLADVSAPALYGGLVPTEELPSRLLRRMKRFEWDPGTVKVDFALSGPVPWATTPDAAPGTVHIAESIDEIRQNGAHLAAGAVPATPFLLCGQMAVADPSRAPQGGESLWLYTHVPHHTTSDAGDGTITGRWDRDDTERMADRMQARVEAYAPGFGDRVLSRRVLGPRELEGRDENLVGGSVNGGTAGLHQQLIFRPVPGLGRPETPVKGLYLASASAHPGGGVHGACGSNAARAALAHDRVRAARSLMATGRKDIPA
ncbi:Phytoene dehydrogenase-related protein [Pedococcus cremeus]|uniref:Phytoene dehydrogenase-related protein n=1 Tax=Pedococcus cremeus TaxID=587636 RepID=A0A1H9XUY7_9MICO|nr:NAD(P)/FAD-dependent oxidoreductase [Pedococcus cremeus]SES49577.1 Phytoene dehydrogenase-related protein [Pedococcus cremeus]